MKTINNMIKTKLAALCLMAAAAVPAMAQVDASDIHLNIDWQMNAPLSTNFADRISGWGMNYELAYSLTPRLDLGLFASFHTNHKYVERSTLAISGTESLTTDQQRSAFQIPFGVTGAYALSSNRYVKPYVGAKLGTMFARNTTYFADRGLYDKSWGFYVSPEVGIKVYPTGSRWGFKVAGYYSYATNQTQTLTTDIDGQSNVGFRVGVMF